MVQSNLKIILNKQLHFLKFILTLNVIQKKFILIKGNDTLYTEKYQDHIPNSFADKVVCVDDNFSKPIVLYRGKNAVYKFIETILKEYDYCKK